VKAGSKPAETIQVFSVLASSTEMGSVRFPRAIAQLAATIDLLILPALWFAAGARATSYGCASETLYFESQVTYYTFWGSLFDAAVRFGSSFAHTHSSRVGVRLSRSAAG
jgi:hypothetical protein